MKTKISIIIPTYNSAGYLPDLLESILAQDFLSYEVIIINDGSTDSTLEVLKQYCPNPRIKILTQQNGGVCKARNRGLDTATGEWIWFVDSDDVIMNGALQSIALAIDEVDMLQCDYLTSPAKDNLPDLKPIGLCGYEKMIELLFSSSCNRFWGYLWSKLFKRENIERFNLRFRENLYFNEDSLFIFEYISNLKEAFRCKIIHDIVYRYYIRPTNTMSQIYSTCYWKYESDLDACIIMCGRAREFKSKRIYRLVLKRLYSSYKRNKSLIKQYNPNPTEAISRIKAKTSIIIDRQSIIKIEVSALYNRFLSFLRRSLISQYVSRR